MIPPRRCPQVMAEVTAELDGHATEGDTSLDKNKVDKAMSAALDVAYAGLSPEAARLYRLLALHVWSADFGVEVAAAVLEVDLPTARAVLDEVARAGLSTPTVADRWVLHDEVWPHARALAYHESAEDRDEAQTCMLNYYRDTALSARAAAAPYLTERVPARARVFPGRAEALAWLETEHSCLVAAARWAHEHGRHRHAWPIVHGMWPLYLHLRPSDWVEVDRLGLEAARATGDPAAEAEALNRLGAAYTHVGDHRAALVHYTLAMTQWRHLGNQHKLAGSLRHLADVVAYQGDYDEAIDQYRVAIRQHQQLGQVREAALGLIGLGQALTRAGRPDAALEPLNEAIDAFHQLTGTPREDPYNAARAATALGMALTALGRLEPAHDLLRDALAQMRQVASRHGIATVCDALATWPAAAETPTRLASSPNTPRP